MTCTPFETQLKHLTSLAKAPGWKAYAWQRAQQLDADDSGLWRGLADALEAAMKSQQPQPDQPSHSSHHAATGRAQS